MSASEVLHFVVQLALLVDFVLPHARVVCFCSTLHVHVLRRWMLHPSKPSFGCRLYWLNVDTVQESHFVSQLFQEMFRHYPFGNSSCQGVQFCFGELNLTVCYVRDHAERVALLHCATPAPCALAGHGLPSRSLCTLSRTSGM